MSSHFSSTDETDKIYNYSRNGTNEILKLNSRVISILLCVPVKKILEGYVIIVMKHLKVCLYMIKLHCPKTGLDRFNFGYSSLNHPTIPACATRTDNLFSFFCGTDSVLQFQIKVKEATQVKVVKGVDMVRSQSQSRIPAF